MECLLYREVIYSVKSQKMAKEVKLDIVIKHKNEHKHIHILSLVPIIEILHIFKKIIKILSNLFLSTYHFLSI